MAKLQSFGEFANAKRTAAEIKLQEENAAKRNSSAETFKSLLSEYNVTSVQDLTEEQKVEFFFLYNHNLKTLSIRKKNFSS